MMVLWEKKSVNVKTLGESLYLDSGTLTPVLKKLESKGYITRERSSEDERNLVVSITCVKLTQEEASCLYNLLYKIIGNVR